MTVARHMIELPASLPPRGLRREEAARYVGYSPNKFDDLVKAGLMPKPRKALGVQTWDRIALDAAYSALPTEEPEPSPKDKEGGSSWD